MAHDVTGPDTIHANDCKHIHRFWKRGGGGLFEGTLEECRLFFRQEFDRAPTLSSCAKERKNA